MKRYEFMCPVCHIKTYVRSTGKVNRFCACRQCKTHYVINRATNQVVKSINIK